MMFHCYLAQALIVVAASFASILADPLKEITDLVFRQRAVWIKDPGKGPIIVRLHPIAGDVRPDHFQACDGDDVVCVLCRINLQQALEQVTTDRMKESG